MTLRLPDDLKQALDEAADASERSLHGEIIVRLRRSIAPSEPPLLVKVESEEALDKIKSVPAEETDDGDSMPEIVCDSAVIDRPLPSSDPVTDKGPVSRIFERRNAQ